MFVIKLVFLIFSNADFNMSVLQMDCAVSISGTLRFMSLSILSCPFTFQFVHWTQFGLYWTVICRGGTGNYIVLLTRWDISATDRGPKLFWVSLSSWVYCLTTYGPLQCISDFSVYRFYPPWSVSEA